MRLPVQPITAEKQISDGQKQDKGKGVLPQRILSAAPKDIQHQECKDAEQQRRPDGPDLFQFLPKLVSVLPTIYDSQYPSQKDRKNRHHNFHGSLAIVFGIVEQGIAFDDDREYESIFQKRQDDPSKGRRLLPFADFYHKSINLS